MQKHNMDKKCIYLKDEISEERDYGERIGGPLSYEDGTAVVTGWVWKERAVRIAQELDMELIVI